MTADADDERWYRRGGLISALALALLAYVPALTAAPGRMPADSKLYLYLDPTRFINDAVTTFDPRQFAGWVPHQHIAYLWPAGPWFVVFDRLGVPDWIAHRLWIGTLLLGAGLGVRWCARVLGLGQLGAAVAAVIYQLSPYVLPYVSRTSVMLLPWAGLGWIVAFTVRATNRSYGGDHRERGDQRHINRFVKWGDPAAIALIVFTVGAVNATALAMIVPAPLLWLVHAAWQRAVSWRQAVGVALRITVLTVPVSLWWLAMLVIQGRYGAEILPYSESLADVSLTATAPEIWRSLGYWLFYVRDPYAATTTESLRYLSSTASIFVSYLLPVMCLFGLVWARWAHRRFACLLIAAGALLAVGVHPIHDRSPLMRAFAGDDEGGLALALRSSTRALPVMNLGMALLAGSLVAACTGVRLRRPAWRVDLLSGGALIAIAIANLPSLWTGGFVDPALERDELPPAAWAEATAELDAIGEQGRVLQLPGAEFGAFRWGYTVDQPLPGLTDKALITRDLLPLGSAGAMDLLYAL
ncbi:MAG TPA: alpha-(1-_3)-arabinofuranosyltransferase family protein, partial [Ilumatobacter sp.]|nr:alpha-(1->3)-arabinofuranosyltransferase family protein [Ilumatobacter sp.]